MKKLIIVFMLLFISSSTSAQQSMNDNCYFILHKTYIFFSNNFIRENEGSGYSPELISPPFREYSYDVFGERFILKILKNDTSNFYQTASGAMMDSTKNNDYEITNLRLQVIKNAKVVLPWTNVINTKKYVDSFASATEGNKYLLREGYIPFVDNLKDTDSLYLSFKGKNKQPFLNIKIKKKFPDSIPLLLQSLRDANNEPLQDYIRKVFENERIINYSFYNDWYSEFFKNNSREKIFPNERLAYYFRKRNDIKTDSAFEYTIIEAGNKSDDWRRSGNVILLYDLKPGKNYQLKVRYIDRPQKVWIRNIEVEGKWYQSGWFKLLAIIILSAIILLVILFAAYYRQRINKRLQDAKIKMLQLQLNPHFTFNALNSIQGLINNNQIQEANKYLTDFAGLLRNTFYSENKNIVSLREDLKALNNYIKIEQLRFPFRYNCNVADAIDQDNTYMLPLLAQPIIENAIKHGIATKGGAGILQINIYIKDKDLIFAITDNGNGFIENKNSAGYGLKLVRERISLFNKYSTYKKIILNIESKKETTVSMIFKNWVNYD